MRIGYIDSSFLLSIVFEDSNYNKSIQIWNNLEIMYSSLLLEIESRINIYKYYMLSKKEKEIYSHKEKDLGELISSINLKIIDNEINLEIRNFDKLKRPRSLDSIHLATANILKKMDDNIFLCSYDKDFLKIGKELGMETI
jgi:predicted nucleic acid-binding protein